MSDADSRERRLIIGAVVGALAGVAILGRDAMPWGAALALAAVGFGAWRRWQYGRAGARVMRGLRAQWLDLHGAEDADDRGAIVVHDGMQPLRIKLFRERGVLRALITTPVGEAPLAFRVWPVGQPAPGLDPDGARVGGPPVERAPFLEARLGGTLLAECSDEAHTDALLDAEVTSALLVVAREAAGSFAGLSYDGQRLGIHLKGPMVADPQRATQVARALWRPFLP
ncbi:MAG: hypothetical protein R3F39_17465 [Myxococcota bacterium]